MLARIACAAISVHIERWKMKEQTNQIIGLIHKKNESRSSTKCGIAAV